MIRQDFAALLAEAVDRAALNGSGLGAEPKGLLKTLGIGAVTFSSATWAKVIEFVSDLETANATGSGWCTDPHVVGILRTTLKESGDAGAGYLMDAPDNLAGYPLVASTIMPATLGAGSKHGLVFGDWSDLLIGYWDSFNILVNPYAESSYAKAAVQVRALLSCDVAVRHPASFAAAQDIT